MRLNDPYSRERKREREKQKSLLIAHTSQLRIYNTILFSERSHLFKRNLLSNGAASRARVQTVNCADAQLNLKSRWRNVNYFNRPMSTKTRPEERRRTRATSRIHFGRTVDRELFTLALLFSSDSFTKGGQTRIFDDPQKTNWL